jgi:hypothetical protein
MTLVINKYNKPKPLNWVIIETWNDWNEGSEIEPSVEDSCKYLDLTTDNVNTFKETSLRKDSWKKYVAYLIYRLGDLIENKPIDFAEFYPLYENSIRCYLQHGRDNLMHNANDIVDVNSIISILTTDIVEPQLALPNEFALYQNYPNPFNSSTQISYSIPNANFVILKIYDILGREVQTLVDNLQKKNTYSINFDASNLSSGIYFYRLQVGKDFVETIKMLLIR